MCRFLLLSLLTLTMPATVLATPPTHTRWSMTLAPRPRPLPNPRRLDRLVDAATRILLAERLAKARLLVVVPCCERPPAVDAWP